MPEGPRPWERDPPPPRRRAPQPLADDREPYERMPGESWQAHTAFLYYLEEGSIRKAAAAAGKHESTFKVYAKRWQWVKRARAVNEGWVARFADLYEYERKHGLTEAAKDAKELKRRRQGVLGEIIEPRIMRQLHEEDERLRREGIPDPEPFDFDPIL